MILLYCMVGEYMNFNINSGEPLDLKAMTYEQLSSLSDTLRENILDAVSKNGGHLASNLGVVELTIALHRVFSSPDDKIIWDVAHQSYTHKLFTGRGDRFDTLRQPQWSAFSLCSANAVSR